MFDVAAVEAIRDGRDLGCVGIGGGVEEVQVDAPDHHLPDVEARDVVTHLNRHLHAGGCQSQAVRVESREAFLLIAVGVEPLAEVALGVQQADGDEWQAEIRGRLQVVAGENPETTAVLRQCLGEPELGGEVGDELERALWPALEPTRLRGGLSKAGCGSVGKCRDLGIGRELGPSRGGDAGDQAQGIVAAGLPQCRLELGEKRLRLAVPGPVDVGGQPAERLETRWDCRNDVELADSAHSGEFSRAGSRRPRRSLSPASPCRIRPAWRRRSHPRCTGSPATRQPSSA